MEKQTKLPLVSVITVSYSAKATIESTILSVINQTYPYIEYIIIDGGSTDGTVDIIKKYADKISYWVSESDKGIYDAMNKGIRQATGEWINFMNSGDIFYNKDIIDKICANIDSCADVVYGDTFLKYSWGVIEKKATPLADMEKHLPFSHQSCLIKLSLMKESFYDLRYQLCADYNFFYSLYKRGGYFQYLPFIFSIYEAEYGLSSINALLLQKELATISGKAESIYWKFCFMLFYIRIKVMGFIKKTIFPPWLVRYYNRKRVL